jgi:hypothetical protein
MNGMISDARPAATGISQFRLHGDLRLGSKRSVSNGSAVWGGSPLRQDEMAGIK